MAAKTSVAALAATRALTPTLSQRERESDDPLPKGEGVSFTPTFHHLHIDTIERTRGYSPGRGPGGT